MSTMPTKGQLHVWHEGRRGRVLTYTRPNTRCPSRDFLEDTAKHLLKRFDRMFERFGSEGLDIADHGSFAPLLQEGKGLWSIKEHDHRLLCFRGPDENAPPRQQVVLLCGWVKDKSDSLEERKQVERAQVLRTECERCVDWNGVIPTRPPKSTVQRLREDLVDPLFDSEFQAALRKKVAEVAPGILIPEQPTNVATKGPAQTPPKPKTDEPVASTPVASVPPSTAAKEETVVTPKPSKEPTTSVTVSTLAELADVPYKWLWLMIKERRLGGFTLDAEGHKSWPWDGIENVVAKVTELRKVGVKGVARDKPKAATTDAVPAITAPRPELLLTLARAARLVGTTKGELRKAVSNGTVQPAEVRNGIRMFRGADVRKWHEGRRVLSAAVAASRDAIPTITAAVTAASRAVVDQLGPGGSGNGKPSYHGYAVQSKADLRAWLDELLARKRTDTENFVTAIRHHMEYRQKLERELQALSEG